jgi:hypothetical protein
LIELNHPRPKEWLPVQRLFAQETRNLSLGMVAEMII